MRPPPTTHLVVERRLGREPPGRVQAEQTLQEVVAGGGVGGLVPVCGWMCGNGCGCVSERQQRRGSICSYLSHPSIPINEAQTHARKYVRLVEVRPEVVVRGLLELHDADIGELGPPRPALLGGGAHDLCFDLGMGVVGRWVG